MAKETMYKRVILRQDNTTIQTNIPEAGAVVGRTMEITDMRTGKKLDGRWECTKVFEGTMTEKRVHQLADRWRKYIEQTDI